MKKTMIILLFVLSLQADKAKVTQHFNVVTTKVQKEVVRLKRKYYGYVTMDESKVVDVVPRFSGYIETLYADKLYKYVKKGEALAKVYSPEVFKAKEEYLQSYRYSKRQNASRMIKSTKLKLLLLGVSPREVDAVVKKGNVGELTTIYAPRSGYIFLKSVNEGSSFKKGDKLFEIVSLSDVWIRIKINENDIEWIRDVKHFDVSFEGQKKSYQAAFDIVEPKLDPKESLYTVRAILQNDTEVYPGMYAKIEASKNVGQRLVVPASAVIRKNGKYYAFLATEFKGEFEPVEVKVKRIGDRYIVKSGLKEGDVIVRSAIFMMDSDAEINALY